MAQAPVLGSGWEFEVERGPDWLFVRPRRAERSASEIVPFAEQVWSLLEQQFTHRLVLELGDVAYLDSQLIGQLIWLYKRIHTHDGLMRVCELSESGEEALHACRLDGRFPSFSTREDAVMGHRPQQPR